jgi:hypothetical protein
MATDSWIRKVAELRNLLGQPINPFDQKTDGDRVQERRDTPVYEYSSSIPVTNAENASEVPRPDPPPAQESPLVTVAAAPTKSTPLSQSPPPSPPNYSPPKLPPPPTRRQSSVRHSEQLKELLPLTEVQRLVRDTVRKHEVNLVGIDGGSPTTRSERIAEMVATAVGQAVVRAVTALGEVQGDELTRLEEENDRLIAIVRGPSTNKAGTELQLGPKAKALEVAGRKGEYPFPRTIVGALRHCTSGDVEPMAEHYVSLATHCKSLRKENAFFRALTEELRVEANRRRDIMEGQIATLKGLLRDNNIPYGSPEKQKNASPAAKSTHRKRGPSPNAHWKPSGNASHVRVEAAVDTHHPSNKTPAADESLDMIFTAKNTAAKTNAPATKLTPSPSASMARLYEGTAPVMRGTPREMAQVRAKEAQQYLVEERRKNAVGTNSGNMLSRLGLHHASKRKERIIAPSVSAMSGVGSTDPYYLDKPEMVDMLLRAEGELIAASKPDATTKTTAEAPPREDSTGPYTEQEAAAIYDNFVATRKKRTYAQQHIVPATKLKPTSPKKEKSPVRRRQSIISKEKRFDMLKKSRQDYGTRSREWAVQSAQEKKAQEHLDRLFSAGLPMDMPQSEEEIYQFDLKSKAVEKQLREQPVDHRRNNSYVELKNAIIKREAMRELKHKQLKGSVQQAPPSWLIKNADEEMRQAQARAK